MQPVRLFSSPELMAEEIALEWQRLILKTEKAGGIFSGVLSGGRTASLMYRRLADKDYADTIPWHLVHLFWADERCVPPESEESNYGNCQRFLLDHIPIPQNNIHRIRGEENPVDESFRYSQEIKNHILLREDQTNFFDWVLLGVGSDGHTASLFCDQGTVNSPNLCETLRHPNTGKTRITLTPLAIRKSHRITYHVIGREKSHIVSELVSKSSGSEKLPAACITGEWYLDQDAASRL